MADSVKRVVTADVYAWMTPIEGVPGRWHHNAAARGEEIEVSRAEAERGEGLGLLRDPAARDQADAEHEAADTDVVPAAEPGGGEPAADGEERPPQVAAKGVWVDYHVARGMDRSEAESMTKQDLIERA